jgi:predicted RNA-binding protein with PIN domain
VTRIPPSQDPLTGVTRLLVDGTNLLHALSRAAGGRERQPPAALIGRLRAAIPAETAIELVFDGPPERGLRGERIAHGVSVRYGGRFTADTILITLAEEAPTPDAVLVVSDDRELRHAVTMRGARTAGSAWLLRRLERPRLSAPSIGNRRPPRIDQPAPGRRVERSGPRRR